MPDDDAMDRLLRMALAAEIPELSPGFDARVLRRVRPRRLTPRGQAVLALYALVAAAASVWLMRDLPVAFIAAAVTACAGVAAATSAYGRRLVIDG
ncbi:MAG: hypothetical protein AB1635_11160 [Acidobacteriota bacterium]